MNISPEYLTTLLEAPELGLDPGTIPDGEVPHLVLAVERLRAALQVRLQAEFQGRQGEGSPDRATEAEALPPPQEDRLLTVRDLAARWGLEPKTIYRRHHEWPFTRRLGRNLRFSLRGVLQWERAQGRGRT